MSSLTVVIKLQPHHGSRGICPYSPLSHSPLSRVTWSMKVTVTKHLRWKVVAPSSGVGSLRPRCKLRRGLTSPTSLSSICFHISLTRWKVPASSLGPCIRTLTQSWPLPKAFPPAAVTSVGGKGQDIYLWVPQAQTKYANRAKRPPAVSTGLWCFWMFSGTQYLQALVSSLIKFSCKILLLCSCVFVCIAGGGVREVKEQLPGADSPLSLQDPRARTQSNRLDWQELLPPSLPSFLVCKWNYLPIIFLGDSMRQCIETMAGSRRTQSMTIFTISGNGITKGHWLGSCIGHYSGVFGSIG